MNSKVLNTTAFREFKSDEEAERWAFSHYDELLNIGTQNELFDIIFSYCGSWYMIINQLLRTCPTFGSDEYRKIKFSNYGEEAAAIEQISRVLYSYALPENIVAYRFTHKCVIRNMCGTTIIKNGLEFSDKAFFSTTLIRDLLESFRKEHKCNCILKLYLPQGTPGAYVSFKTDKTKLNEQEFLLPPNMKFKIIRVNHFTNPLLLECALIS